MPDTAVVLFTAAAIAFVHAVTGPDHYLPFVALARAFGWSRSKLVGVTVLCGLGHVLASLLIGLFGIALGVGLGWFDWADAVRGRWATWALIAFGLTYAAWGLVRAHRRRPHRHVHAHEDGTVHSHDHVHERAHLHPHPAGERRWRLAAPWTIFVVFLLGPCEPMIPLIMFPAVNRDWLMVALVAGIFTAVTLATMVALVLAGHAGLQRWRLPRLEPYAHALAGALVAACGLAVLLLG